MEHEAVNSAGAGKGSLNSYLAGFFLAVILTIIPFGLVMSGVLPKTITIVAIFAAAIVQMLVHLHYFLHLDTSSEERWNLLAILFTALIILILVGGSIWIMVNLHYRMMDQAVLHTAGIQLAAAMPR
ncbi:MAG: cytochrome o ubiquinol oxidase subunit IV [Gammaproteobacteria bacterium]|jgi:cytochrome o ubiquinol oxidase subunit IV